VSLITLVAGQYTTTWNSVSVGVTRQGFELQQQVRQEVIAETDAYGESTIDFIYRGGDVFCQFISRSYAAGSTGPFWPWGGGTLGVMSTAAVPIATLASAVAQPLVLTVVANTPAVAAPNTLTGALSILAPNFNGNLIFDSRLRDVPVRHQFLPTAASGTVKWFALT
jgi:hypothetical protein